MKKLLLVIVALFWIGIVANAQVLFTDNFESGTTQWALTGAWGLSITQSTSPTHSLTESPTGNYTANLNTYATMTTGVDLSTYPSSSLSFWGTYKIETGFDYMYVEVSSDNFTTFTTIATFSGNETIPLPAFQQYTYDLGGFCGNSNVKVRFHFFSDSGVQSDGMYIDDFSISGSTIDNSPPLIIHNPQPYYQGSLGSMVLYASLVDYSGINLTASKLVYNVDGGANQNISPVLVSGNNYSFTIPTQAPGAYVSYHIYAVDNYSTPNNVTSPTYAYISGNHIIQDNGVVDFYSPITASNGVSVKIALGNANLVGMLIRNYTDNTHPNDSMVVHVWNDNAGLPGTDVITPFKVKPAATLSNTSAMKWIDLRSFAANLTGLTGTYYIGFTVPSGIVNITITEPGSFGRSYVYNGTTWALSQGTNGIIDNHFRAITSLNQDVEGPHIINNTPPVLHEANLNAQTISATVTDMTGVASTDLHYKVDNGTAQIVTGVFISGNNYSYVIPAQPAGVWIKYWLSAIDAVTPTPYTSQTDTFVYVSGLYHKFDNGTPDMYISIGTIGGVSTIAEKIDLGTQHTNLTSLLIRNYYSTTTPSATPNNPMTIHVWGDNAGLPGTDLITPFVIPSEASATNPMAVTKIDLRSYSAQLSNLTGNIYAGFVMPTGDCAVLVTNVGTFVHTYIDGTLSQNDAEIRIVTTALINPLPDNAGTISGTINICQGQSITYTVPVITNATSYIWTLPTGATGTSSTNSITVNYGTSAVSGNITVKGHNSLGDGAISTLAITVNPLPSSAGTISGTATVCQGQNSVAYTVPVITNATSYIWTLPTGATGTSTTNSITVNYGTSAVSGNITVKGNNSCGYGAISTKAITVNPLPANAGTISGTTAVCQGQNSITYTVPAITNATSYVWTLPTGATGTSTTNSITVDYGTSAVSGNITVKGNNSCGNGVISTKAITVNPLPTSAGTISGTTTVCQGQNSVTYTVLVITNATSYIWTLPTGATGTSTTNSITVNYGISAVSGNITVKGNNSCGNGAISTLAITVNPLPLSAGTISGTIAVCQGQNSVTYTVPAITNATSYIWSLPTGATGTSTTNSITVNYGISAVSGNITVKGNNSCGDGAISTLAITVNQLTASAGTISGVTSVCQGQNAVIYTVPAIANATSYVWTLPSGATGTSSTNSITVNFSISAVSGGIEVYGQNTCGVGSASIIAVSVNSLPGNAGTISGNTTVCQGQNSITYTIPAITNATSYIWTLPTGATGTSNTNSITVNYGTSAISGNITVKGNNSSCDGLASTLAITVNSLPSNAGTISGNTTVCQGQNLVTYAVPTIANATSYVWSLPSGVTGSSNTNTITVDYGSSAISGNITVKGNNSCGDGSSSTIAITVNPLPSNAGTISGTTAICQGQNSVTYTVPAITNATSYIWTLPIGATGTSTTNSITVNYGTSAISGNITVKGNNSCGDGTYSTLAITVNTVPSNAGTISGTTTVCQGQNSVVYAVPTIANATSYVWTLPSGATGTSSTNSITVNYGTSAVSGGVEVYGQNTCGNGNASVIAVLVNALPSTPAITLNGNVLQSDAATGNQWYNQNGLINGATGQNYTPTIDGDYYVVVTDNGCSSDPSNTINVIVSGIVLTENNKTINVYPNPVTNELNIEFVGNKTILNFEIINSIGQVVFKGIISEKTIVQTSNFDQGIYMIKLENGKTFEFKKIIKE